MLIAKIDNPVPLNYREAFPETSFTSSGPSDEFLSKNGYAKVSVFKDHDSKTQKLVPSEPYYEAPWVYTVMVAEKTQEDIDLEIQSQWASVRLIRDKKLQESDWTRLDDVTLSVEKKAEWAVYRQELRDVTNQPDPFNIIWPAQPQP